MNRYFGNNNENTTASCRIYRRVLLLLAVLSLILLCGCSTADPAGNNSGGENSDTVSSDNQIVELDFESSITQEGDYKIDGLLTDILSDEVVADGWVYYYSEGTQDIVEMTEWEKADGMYTSCEISLIVTNLQNKMKESFTERIKAAVFFDFPADFDRTKALDSEYVSEIVKADNNGSCQPEVFPMTVLQDNPGQTSPEGYQTHSKDAVLLSEGESVRIWMMADVSERFLRSWENESAAESMWAYLDFGDGTVYAVDLRKYLKASDV